jgi:hypothetical protein
MRAAQPTPKHRARRPRRSSHAGAMLRPKKYSEAERRLGGLARKIAMQRNVLYHGTRHVQSVLTTGVLFPPEEGGKVCFTRSADEAAYWALLPRTEDEGHGAILIFDRQLLHCRYRIEPNHDPIFDTNKHRRDEYEEEIWSEVVNVGKYLIGLVSEPAHQSSDKLLKERNRRYRANIEVRLNDLLYYVPEWRCRPEEFMSSAAVG